MSTSVVNGSSPSDSNVKFSGKSIEPRAFIDMASEDSVYLKGKKKNGKKLVYGLAGAAGMLLAYRKGMPKLAESIINKLGKNAASEKTLKSWLSKNPQHLMDMDSKSILKSNRKIQGLLPRAHRYYAKFLGHLEQFAPENKKFVIQTLKNHHENLASEAKIMSERAGMTATERIELKRTELAAQGRTLETPKSENYEEIVRQDALTEHLEDPTPSTINQSKGRVNQWLQNNQKITNRPIPEYRKGGEEWIEMQEFPSKRPTTSSLHEEEIEMREFPITNSLHRGRTDFPSKGLMRTSPSTSPLLREEVEMHDFSPRTRHSQLRRETVAGSEMLDRAPHSQTGSELEEGIELHSMNSAKSNVIRDSGSNADRLDDWHIEPSESDYDMVRPMSTSGSHHSNRNILNRVSEPEYDIVSEPAMGSSHSTLSTRNLERFNGNASPRTAHTVSESEYDMIWPHLITG